MKPRSKKFYDDFANVVKQHVKKCFPNIEIRAVGSRNRGDFQRTSDFDYQFCIEGGETTKEKFYPKLIKCLEKEIAEYKGEKVRVELGGSGNVVNVFPESGGKVSLALEPCSKFQ
ncbi:MAG: nucleotidyltransferase domain-containing protein [Candidatus Heimdallarchaeum endolithica]|uniref:Nucleotidyltransferase domain-containing protein n=1 Tax=Candidatus Heimdallarchaeum endolithica TaxID=2876572 RepID=A0A9Y1FNN8_9ARCH|nr:MAG: nucleotidyltransferase domain-containing protein [Candidatus Heimdallarchaeum endolithica]